MHKKTPQISQIFRISSIFVIPGTASWFKLPLLLTEIDRSRDYGLSSARMSLVPIFTSVELPNMLEK
ncbi:MAG: hypothetical protein U9N85_02455 [Bacteroidota bacterium]|nr:hypothetical protein [Bacteroidota bacterium]